MGKSIVLIGTLDTKGDESLYIKNLIEGNDYRLLPLIWVPEF